ncbi:MAG TPA: hypothetical protein PK395_14805 [bacterium]|nr:hypothetical protein [bacterium]
METGSEIRTFAGHKLYSHARNVISVAFSPDGTKVLTRGADGTAKIWDAGKGLEIRTFGSDFEEEMRVGFFIEFSPNGKMILSTGSGIRAALWDAESGAQIRKFGNPGSQSNSAVFSPDGTKVLAVNENMDVDLWDVETGGKVQTFTGHTSRVDCASLSPDGTRIVTSSGILWDVRTGKEQMRIFPPERFRGIGGSAAAFSRDGKEVLIGRKSAIWSMAIGEELPGRPSQTFTGNYLGLSPDGMPIITDGHMIELIKETGEMERFSGHTDAVLSAAFSSDGTKMVTGSRDKTARLWDVETGSQIRAFQGHEDSVDAVALSPDGTKVLTGSQDKTARLWDAETGQEIERFERHTRRVSTVAFSPDGTAYLTGSIDGTVMLMRPGREPASFPHGGMVSSVAFTPDGTKILTTSLDGTTRIWDLGDSAQVSAATPEVESATADHSSRTSERGTEKGVAESEAVRSQVTPSSNVAAFSSLRGPSGESIFGLGELLSAAYSPDGKYIATCGGLGAFLWDVESNRLIRAFLGHTKEVYSVDFSPDGTKIVTGSNDKTARIWNTETGDLIRTFAGHTKGVRAAVFSPDGKKVVTGSWDAAKLWDSETGAEIRTFSSPQSGVSDVAFSPDGKKVLAGDTGNAARIWDTETGSEIRTFTGHGDQVRSVAFSPDGTKVLTGSKDGAAKIWDAETGLEIRTFAGHKSDVYSVAMSPDGKKVLTGGRGNIAALWDTESGTQIRTYGEPGSTATSVTFSPDGTRVLAAGGDMNAHVWNTETGEEIQTLTGHTSPLFSTALSPDGTKIVTSSGMLWDLTTGKAVQTFSPRQIAECILAAFLPDGAKVLMGFSDSAVFLDAETGTEIRRFKKITFTENIMALSPDGRRILTGSQWTAKLWDVGTGEEIRTFSGHTAKVWSLAFSPDGTRVLTGARDNTARLWDVETGAQIQAFFGHDGAVRSVALSPDQKRVLTGSEDNTARLWNAETGAQIRTLSGHTGNVSAVAFSPDGTECLTGSWDGTVKLWRRELVKTFVHNGGVSTVTYLPDGTRILTGSRDGTIRIWDLGELAQVSAAGSKETRRTFDSLPDREEGPTATPTEESPTPIPRAETATTAPDLDKRLSGPVTANRTDLSLILILMASEAGLKLTIDPGINPKVTFSLENPTVRQVLETVLPEEGLDYLIMPGGALRIGDVAVIQAEKQSPHVQRTDQAPGLDKRLEGPILATQTDLFQMLTLIAADTGLKLTIDPGINRKVTFLLENPTAREVLDTILPGEGLDYMVMPGGVVRIGIAEVIAPARQNPPERRLDNAPDLDKRIEGPIRANQNPLAQILTIVSGETGFNFSLDRDIEPKVTFCMDSPTVREILEAVLPGQGLDYVVTSSGVVRIGPEKLIARTRTHPPGESRQKAPGLDERIQGPIVASQTDLSQILTLLGNDTGANFTLDSDSNVKVTFAMKSPTVRQILDGVLPGQGLDYIVLPSGVIRIGRSSNGSHVELVTETFTARPEHIPVLEKAFDAVKTRNAKIKSEPDLNRITVTDTPEAIDSMRQLTTKIKVEPTTTLRLWVFFIEESADVSLSDLSNALHSVKSKDGLLLGSHPHRMFLVIDHPSVVKKMKNIVFSWEPNITPFYFADRDCPDAITANQVLQSWFSETPTAVPETPVAKPTPLPLAENYKIESILGKAAILIDYTLKPLQVTEGAIVDDPLGKFEVVEIDEGNRRVRVKLLFDGHERWIRDWMR